MYLINVHSVQGNIRGMTFILEVPVGGCMWHVWRGWGFGGKMEMRDDLICTDLYNREILFSWWFLVDGLFCTFDIKLNGPWLGVLLSLTFLKQKYHFKFVKTNTSSQSKKSNITIHSVSSSLQSFQQFYVYFFQISFLPCLDKFIPFLF